MSRERLERIDDEGLAAWNGHDSQAFVELFAEEFVWRDATVPESIRTGEEAKAFMQSWFDAFPDMHVRRVSRVVDADALAVEMEFTATNTGPLALGGMSLPATGRSLVGRGTYFVTVKDGKIVEFNSYPDAAGILAQLGLMGPG